MSAYHGEFLLIESHIEFINEIQKDTILLSEFPLLIQKSLSNGLKIIDKQRNSIRIVIISTLVLQTEQSLKDFKNAIGNLPHLFISHRDNHPFQSEFPEDLTVHNPKNYKDIIEKIKDTLEKKPSWQDYEDNYDEKFVPVKFSDTDFVGIKIKNFVFLPKSHFNIFIRIGTGNYIKILNAGDKFEKEVLESYTNKGFQDVYMPTIEHQKYMTLCEIISTKVLNSTKINPSDKLKSVFRLGNELSKNLLKTGIQFPNLDYAETFLDQSVMMIKGLNLKDGNLKKFIRDIESNQHTTAVSFLAGVIANELGFESSKSVKLVGLAALVHDIGLFDLCPDIEEHELSADNEFFIKHAKHGSELLRKSGCFDEVVCMAVEQHHLRRRASDPAERSHQMNLVSEIVGVADTFHNIVLAKGFSAQKLDYFLNYELGKFSHQIEKAMFKILDQKRKAS